MSDSQRRGDVYEVRPRSDKWGFDLISDAVPFGRVWYGEPNAIGHAKFFSRSHDAVSRVYEEAGNVIETLVDASGQSLWLHRLLLANNYERGTRGGQSIL